MIGPTCEVVMLRLVDDPDDVALSAHVRSCLRCFRAACDLREVGRITGLLREGTDNQVDIGPDPEIWDRLPATLGRAFDRRHSRPPGPLSATWARVRATLRAPVPAALAGAAAAGLLTVSVMGGYRARPVEQAAPRGAAADVELGVLLGDDDLWDALDLPEMRRAMAIIAADGDGSAAELDASPVEDVELLEGEDLELVAAAFEARPPF